MKQLGEPVSFTVKPLSNKVLPAQDPVALNAFKRKAEDLDRVAQSASSAISNAFNEVSHMRKAITHMEDAEDKWLNEIIALERKLKAIQFKLSGDPLKYRLDQNPTPTVTDRISRVLYENKYSSSHPTMTHRNSLAIAEEELSTIVPEVRAVLEKDLHSLRVRLQEAGAPYTPNAIPVFNRQ
jgi:hypothetical protein